MEDALHLESQDLVLRPLEIQDNQDFIKLVTRDSFGKYLPSGKVDEATAKMYFEKILNTLSNQVWSARDNQDKHFAGFIGYQSIIFEDVVYTMFFFDFFEKYWQTTIPLQASQFVCNYTFNKGISNLIAFVNPQDIQTLSIISEMQFKLLKETPCFGATMLMFNLVRDV